MFGALLLPCVVVVVLLQPAVVVVALLAAAAVLAAEWSTSYLTRQIEHARQTCVT